MDLFKQLFLKKKVIEDKYKKKNFSPQIVPYTAKLCLSLVLMHFGGIHRELFFLDIKVAISETSTEILRKLVFVTMFEKRKILRKIWICLSNCFQ